MLMGSLASAEGNPAIPINGSLGRSTALSNGSIHQGDIHGADDVSVISVEEVSLHMDGARMADANKEYSTAAGELRMIQSHVQSQLTALQNANARLTGLIEGTQNGKVTPLEMDKVFVQVRNAMDRTHVFIPIASEEIDVFMPEMDYHLARAKQEWHSGHKRASSKDVRLAVSYMRLRQDALAATKEGSRAALEAAEKSLSELAGEIRRGDHLLVQKIDSEFSKAAAAWKDSF
jgi:hypothetical protein